LKRRTTFSLASFSSFLVTDILMRSILT
jgi:hypothetical protein